MPMVPNDAALADGYVPVEAREVVPGDWLWRATGLALCVEPVVAPDGFISMGGDFYSPWARVYVRP